MKAADDSIVHLAHPSVPPDIDLVRLYFASQPSRPELRNPHVEPRVTEKVRGSARPSAILIALVPGVIPRLIVTRRQPGIRFAGHVCFPGGTKDEEDQSLVETALRETHEEVNLAPEQIDVLGCLGDYYTQSGYRITPVVGIVQMPFEAVPNPAEVAEIYEISLERVLQSGSYELDQRSRDRAHFAFREGNIRIGGPTVSIMIGFYESLLAFQGLIEPG